MKEEIFYFDLNTLIGIKYAETKNIKSLKIVQCENELLFNDEEVDVILSQFEKLKETLKMSKGVS